MKLYFVVCGILLVVAGSLQAQDLTTPESAVRYLLGGFCVGDIGEAINCIENAKFDPLLEPMGRSMKLSPYKFALSDIRSQIESDRATLTMKVTLLQTGSSQIQEFNSTVKLHNLGGKWRIVANRDGPFQPGKPDPVNAAIRALADPHAMENYLKTARDRARVMEGCISNLTSLGTALLMLVHNHDNRYAINAANFEKFLDQYLPNRIVFRCPSDHKGAESYAFNANLVGVLYPAIKDPSTLVAIYEGHGGKLRFKHEGKAGVAFADGHVKMVSEEESKTLRWEP